MRRAPPGPGGTTPRDLLVSMSKARPRLTRPRCGPQPVPRPRPQPSPRASSGPAPRWQPRSGQAQGQGQGQGQEQDTDFDQGQRIEGWGGGQGVPEGPAIRQRHSCARGGPAQAVSKLCGASPPTGFLINKNTKRVHLVGGLQQVLFIKEGIERLSDLVGHVMCL
jgi:hypothetical protein